MSTHQYSKTVNLHKLADEIHAAIGKKIIGRDGFPADGYVVTDPPQITITFATDLSGPQTTLLDTTLANHTPGSNTLYKPIHKVDGPPTAGRIPYTNWYETDNGNGTYSGLSEQTIYNWIGPKLVSKKRTFYFADGGIQNEETTSYFTAQDGSTIEKRS